MKHVKYRKVTVIEIANRLRQEARAREIRMKPTVDRGNKPVEHAPKYDK